MGQSVRDQVSGTVAGVILCGGAGSRMSGMDKPLMEVQGVPMVEHVLSAMSPCVDHVIISCNRNLERYRELGHRLVTDEVQGIGPLEGIRSALLHCETDWLLCAPGDCPRVTTEIFERLLAVSATGDTLAAVAFDGERQQNLFSLLHRSLMSTVESQLAEGVRSVYRVLDRCGAVRVDCADLAPGFVNINESSDLDAL